MANFVEVEFKRTKSADVGAALWKHMQQHFHAGDVHPDDLKPDLEAINKLRAHATIPSNGKPQVHWSVLKDMLAYQAQLLFVMGKFPADIGVAFRWFPIFDAQGAPQALNSALPGMLPSQTPVSISSLAYERTCILFNIGAMYAALAVAERRSDQESIKRAVGLFQNACGCFQHLKEDVLPNLTLPPDTVLPCSPELSAPCIQAFIDLCLAQAQECSWQQAVLGRLKDGTVARISMKVSELYESALCSAKEAQGGGPSKSWPLFMFPTALTNHLSSKQSHFSAAAQFRKSCDDLAASRYGDEIARLRVAEKLVKDGLSSAKRASRPRVAEDLKTLQAIVADNLARAVKDNELIYLQPITPMSSLSDIQSAPMAKATIPPELAAPIDHLQSSALGTPLFQTLVPHGVHLAISIYDDRKDQLVRTSISERAEELDALAASFLHSLGLPGSLQAVDTPAGIPASLQQKAVEIRNDAGPSKIRTMMTDVERLGKSNRSVLDEVYDILDKEDAEDAAAMPERQRSSQANVALAQKADQFNQLVSTAAASDETIRRKYRDCSDLIERLAGSNADIEALLPQSSGTQRQSPQQVELSRQLRQLMEDLEQVSARRHNLVSDAKRMAMGDEIRPLVLREAGGLTSRAHGQHSLVEAAHFEPLFEQQLQKYDMYLSTMSQSEKEQQCLLQQAETTSQTFSNAKETEGGGRDREEALQKFDIAYSRYREVLGNLAEGLKFYSDLAAILHQLRHDAAAWAQQRNAELQSLSGKLSQLNISGQDSEAQQARYGAWNPGGTGELHFG